MSCDTDMKKLVGKASLTAFMRFYVQPTFMYVYFPPFLSYDIMIWFTFHNVKEYNITVGQQLLYVV